MGGAGKTPTALYIAELLQARGERPVFLSRGYGGKLRGPHLVSLKQDCALDVGDEPLLLAASAPTVISADRTKGAKFIEAQKQLLPSVIIMDDGFQNPTLFKDLNLIVVDATTLIGNGYVFPAGPLRAPINFQIEIADVIIKIGRDDNELSHDFSNLQLKAHVISDQRKETWNDKPVIAYSGIARPEKFHSTLQDLGADIRYCIDFPDHHQFDKQEVLDLLSLARETGLQLVTTQKDYVRLSASEKPYSDLKEQSKVVSIKLKLSEEGQDKLKMLLERLLK